MPIEPGPELLRDWIARAARRHPAKPWIVCADDGRTVTYRELHAATGRIAAFLSSRGIEANQRVALLANNSIEHLVCYFGVMSYGATVCTVHVEMNRNQLDNIFARLKPALVLHRTDWSWTTSCRPSRRRACGSDASMGRTRGHSTPRSPAMSRATHGPPRVRTTTPSSCSRRAPARGPRAWC